MIIRIIKYVGIEWVFFLFFEFNNLKFYKCKCMLDKKFYYKYFKSIGNIELFYKYIFVFKIFYLRYCIL